MGFSKKSFSFIDQGMIVEGRVVCQGRLVIKGTVKGILECREVVIAPEGKVKAEVKASTMVIGGVFEGTANASDSLSILTTGRCAGKIICRDLVVEEGGLVNAEIVCLELKKNDVPKDDKSKKRLSVEDLEKKVKIMDRKQRAAS